MKLLADVHISPATVLFLRGLGHDTLRVSEALDVSAPDGSIIDCAAAQQRAILTQDLDFSALMALSGRTHPSIITLRLASSRVEYVNTVLEKVLPTIAQEVAAGTLVTVEDRGYRSRALPL